MAAKAFIFPEICELRLDLLNCLRIIFQLKKGSLEGNVFLNITEQHGRCIVICFDYLGLLRHAVAVDPELSRFVASLPFWRQLQVKRDGTTAKRFVTEVNDFIVLFQLVSGHAHEAESTACRRPIRGLRGLSDNDLIQPDPPEFIAVTNNSNLFYNRLCPIDAYVFIVFSCLRKVTSRAYGRIFFT